MKDEKTLPKILMGFDFGTKRIGIAVGQTITQTARALATAQNKAGEPEWHLIEKLIKKWQPELLVVGIPLNMDGTEQRLTELARAFAEKCREKYQLPVEEIDERLTTKDAREQLFTKGGYQALQDGQVDRLAAQLILQNWFADHLN